MKELCSWSSNSRPRSISIWMALAYFFLYLLSFYTNLLWTWLIGIPIVFEIISHSNEIKIRRNEDEGMWLHNSRFTKSGQCLVSGWVATPICLYAIFSSLPFQWNICNEHHWSFLKMEHRYEWSSKYALLAYLKTNAI